MAPWLMPPGLQEPPFAVVLHFKKVTTAENASIPLRVIRDILIQVLAGKKWEMLISDCFRFFC